MNRISLVSVIAFGLMLPIARGEDVSSGAYARRLLASLEKNDNGFIEPEIDKIIESNVKFLVGNLKTVR